LIEGTIMVTTRQSKIAQDKQIYQFKVTLENIKPPIWRRFQVASNISLGKLHAVLQVVMGWTNSHLHQFIINGKYYGMADEEFDMDIADEDEKILNQIVRVEGAKFVYEYDFGDSWTHKLVLEKILPLEIGVRYPHCITGKRACPPEDCGGCFGYYGLLEIIKNPKHEEYKETLGWLGGKFDSEAFSLKDVNSDLNELG